MIQLSKRLMAIHDLIPQNAILADVGTDHGLLIAKSIESGKVRKAYGLDIAKLPLSQAQKNITKYDLNDCVELQLRNGLEGFEGDADCFVIAGMGAETIWDIILGYTFNKNDLIIIQSNTKNPWLRQKLSGAGFEIEDEIFMFDRTIPTFIIKVSYSQNERILTEQEQIIGPILSCNKDVEYIKYLQQRRDKLQTIKQHDENLSHEFNVIQTYLEGSGAHE